MPAMPAPTTITSASASPSSGTVTMGGWVAFQIDRVRSDDSMSEDVSTPPRAATRGASGVAQPPGRDAVGQLVDDLRVSSA
jgi:hypothetical protein